MKRFRVSVVIFIAVLCVVGVNTKVHAQSVNNFTVQNFVADYYLAKGPTGHSQLKTVEKITVLFPQADQNHGIERAIPQSYNQHSTRVNLNAVTDGDGRPAQYITYQSSGNLVVRIGSLDQYVHGQQTYILTYTQADVTATFNDHDELYWNTNGTQWNEPFEALTAQVHIPQSLVSAYQNRTACYEGEQNSTSNTCVVATAKDRNGGIVISFQPGRALQPNENVTFVLGFNKNTFVAYHMSTKEAFFHYVRMAWKTVGYILPFIALVFDVYVWRKFGRNAKGRETIVPEYVPPAQPTLLQNAQLLGRARKSVTAQIIQMAVRGNIKVYDTVTKRRFGRDAHNYELAIANIPVTISVEEQMVYSALFPWPLKTGTRARLSDYKAKLGRTVETINKTAANNLTAEGYYNDHRSLRKKLYFAAAALVALGIVTQTLSVSAAGIVLLVATVRTKSRTQKGTEALEYLKGLKMYMDMAEADRIRYLQSPSSAEKTAINVNDRQQLVKLYEKLLPYAILFGIEKQWAKQFARLYDNPPEWYAGNWSTFNAVVFVNAVGGFSENVTTTFAPPSSLSSSGFSGGFSGGGGGGGGGGGW